MLQESYLNQANIYGQKEQKTQNIFTVSNWKFLICHFKLMVIFNLWTLFKVCVYVKHNIFISSVS